MGLWQKLGAYALGNYTAGFWMDGFFGVAAAVADEWNQFRGPNGAGVAAEEARPPLKVSGEVLGWKVGVPEGRSSPVVFGGKVFLTGVEDGRLVTLCLDRENGELLWKKRAPERVLEKVHEASSPAASTPFVDGDRAFVYFGSFGLLCYDHEGNEIWKKEIETPKSLYGMSTSPVGFGEALILVLDDERNLPESRLSRSKVVAFSKAGGEVIWETGRPQHRSAWSTPMVWKHAGGEELVVLGNGRVRSYDPKNGEEMWSLGGFSKEVIAVPVAGDGHVYVASSQLGGGSDAEIDPEPFWEAILRFDADGDGKVAAGEMTDLFTYPLRPELPLGHPGFGIPLPKDADARRERQRKVFGGIDKDKDGFWTKREWETHLATKTSRPLLAAIRPGGTGDIEKTHVRWELNKGLPEVPSPIFFDGRIYMVRNGGLLTAVDAESGKILYRERLGASGHYSASPVVADGHLYLVSEQGVVSVVKAGGEFAVAHQFDLEEKVLATPAYRWGHDLCPDGRGALGVPELRGKFGRGERSISNWREALRRFRD